MQKPNALENATIVRTLLTLTCINVFVSLRCVYSASFKLLLQTIVGVGPDGMHKTPPRYSNYRDCQPTT